MKNKVMLAVVVLFVSVPALADNLFYCYTAGVMDAGISFSLSADKKLKIVQLNGWGPSKVLLEPTTEYTITKGDYVRSEYIRNEDGTSLVLDHKVGKSLKFVDTKNSYTLLLTLVAQMPDYEDENSVNSVYFKGVDMNVWGSRQKDHSGSDVTCSTTKDGFKALEAL